MSFSSSFEKVGKFVEVAFHFSDMVIIDALKYSVLICFHNLSPRIVCIDTCLNRLVVSLCIYCFALLK